MIQIKLSDSGRFFSGRSHAVELIEKYCPSSLSEEKITIDFQQVDSFTQSFISELFVNLRKRNLDFSNLTLVGIADDGLLARAKKEMNRIRVLEF